MITIKGEWASRGFKTASGQGCPLVYIIRISEQLLINEIFAQGDIFLQRIEHALQRLLFKRAERANRTTLFYTIFAQQQRL